MRLFYFSPNFHKTMIFSSHLYVILYTTKGSDEHETVQVRNSECKSFMQKKNKKALSRNYKGLRKNQGRSEEVMTFDFYVAEDKQLAESFINVIEDDLEYIREKKNVDYKTIQKLMKIYNIVEKITSEI